MHFHNWPINKQRNRQLGNRKWAYGIVDKAVTLSVDDNEPRASLIAGNILDAMHVAKVVNLCPILHEEVINDSFLRIHTASTLEKQE